MHLAAEKKQNCRSAKEERIKKVSDVFKKGLQAI